MPSFAELSDYWIFCGYELLRIRWEKSRAFAITDTDRETLRRMEDEMRNRMHTDLRHTKSTEEIDELVLQTNGDKYAGPLVGDRFQVMEGWTSGAWYIVDHTQPDYLHRVNGKNSDIARFATKKDAEDYVSRFTSTSGSDRDAASSVEMVSTGNRVRNEMAKAARKEETSEAPKRGRGRPPAEAPADRAPSKRGRKSATTSGEIEFPVVAKKGGPKAAESAPEGTSEASSGGRGRKLAEGGISGTTRSVIMSSKGRMTEAEMLAKVSEILGGRDVPKNAVKVHHAKLTEMGMNPPPIKPAK